MKKDKYDPRNNTKNHEKRLFFVPFRVHSWIVFWDITELERVGFVMKGGEFSQRHSLLGKK